MASKKVPQLPRVTFAQVLRPVERQPHPMSGTRKPGTGGAADRLERRVRPPQPPVRPARPSKP